MTAARTAHTTRLLTPAQAAARIGVRVPTLAGYTYQGLLACTFTPGGHRRFKAPDIERFLAVRGKS